MRVNALLHRLFDSVTTRLHQKRVAAVIAAVDALLSGRRLTLTALGRSVALSSSCFAKHCIKRIDRLLGNAFLHQELPIYWKALASMLVAQKSRPVILVDWTQMAPCSTKWAIVASIAFKGRAVPIYAQVHLEKRLGHPRAVQVFLKKLRALFPHSVNPILIFDAGFRNPVFQCCKTLGFDYIGRVTANTKLSCARFCVWTKAQSIYKLAKRKHALDLGRSLLAQHNAIETRLVLYKSARRPKHRGHVKNINTKGVHKGSTVYKKYQRRATDPWLLCSSLYDCHALSIAKLYAKRMHIEANFRDTKCPRFGFAFAFSKTRLLKRLNVLWLIAALATYVASLLGAIAEHLKWHRHFQANSLKHRRIISCFSLGLHLFAYPLKLPLNYVHHCASQLPFLLAFSTQKLLVSSTHLSGDP